MTVNNRTKQWWKEAVVYQIYPASFCDSNGDGIGDLAGITAKLDYLKDLGADVIWICPMYESPQVDMGYDISNYEDIHRPYGTVEDMEILIKETHARNMRVMLDLVINHTSDQHAWFKESRSSKANPKRDWYIWRPATISASGERLPPNNWRCNFGGGSAWKWDDQTQEYYLHLFAEEQPDLNWENEETRKAIYETSMEFWLKRGIDGFRVDTVNMYSKPPALPDAPVVDPKSPYQPAQSIYCNGPHMHAYLSEMNTILSKYGAITVGELPATPSTEKVLKYVSAEAKQLDMVFQFDIVDLGHGTTHYYNTKPRNFGLPKLKAALHATQSLIRGNDAWTTIFLENHDQARSVSRFTPVDDASAPETREAAAKMLALMQACLSGTQYIYQGQEIGLVNAPKSSYPLENYLDINSRLFVDMVKERHGEGNAAELDKAFDALQYLARDHSRIPIPWNGGAGGSKYGGFSEVAEQKGIVEIQEPWMKPHPLALEINVAAQLGKPDSVLGHWKKMLAFRRKYADLLVYGDYEGLRMNEEDVLIFLKEPHTHNVEMHGERIVVLLNFTLEDRMVVMPSVEELGLVAGVEVQFVRVASSSMMWDRCQSPIPGQEISFAPLEGRAYHVKC